MADLADLTSDNDFNEEILRRYRDSDIKAAKRGRCLNCDAEVMHLFCDADCKEDYEYQQAITSKTRK